MCLCVLCVVLYAVQGTARLQLPFVTSQDVGLFARTLSTFSSTDSKNGGTYHFLEFKRLQAGGFTHYSLWFVM